MCIRRRNRSATGLLATAASLALLTAPALAGPLDDAHVADTGFSGPTTGDLTAVYWNPAGLGLLQGAQAILSGTLETTSVSIDRTSIDGQTGANPGGVGFPTATGNATRTPFRWPLGPQGFFAIGAGIGHRFGIAVAMYSPFTTKLDMKPTPDGQEPARYHLVSMELDHIALTPAIAIHASDNIDIGFASGFLFPTAHLVFDEDTALGNPALAGYGAENPATAARYDLATRGIISPSYFLTVGADYRRGRLALGFAYTSAPLFTGGAITLPLDNVHIGIPSAFTDTSLCASNPTGDCVVGQMVYHLPSIYSLGASWQLSRNWSITGMGRWLRYGGQDKITILLAGPSAQQTLGTMLPDHIVMYRGFVDSFDVRGRLVFDRKPLRLSATFRVETSAVPPSHVDAAAIDGTKLEPSVAAEMHLWHRIRIGASYAFLWMLPVQTGDSIFDPTAVSACAAAGGDLSAHACQQRLNGQALPSAAGTYHLWRQTLSVYTTIEL